MIKKEILFQYQLNSYFIKASLFHLLIYLYFYSIFYQKCLFGLNEIWKYLEFSIEDSGIGIKENDLK